MLVVTPIANKQLIFIICKQSQHLLPMNVTCCSCTIGKMKMVYTRIQTIQSILSRLFFAQIKIHQYIFVGRYLNY